MYHYYVYVRNKHTLHKKTWLCLIEHSISGTCLKPEYGTIRNQHGLSDDFWYYCFVRNVASKKTLGWFVRYARAQTLTYDFITVASVPGEISSTERQDHVHVITQNGWRDDASVRHVTSYSSSPATVSNEVGYYCL